jgi:myo-inositol-1(or 4)-monophosphatase
LPAPEPASAPPCPTPAEDRDVIVAAAREAGALAMRHFRGDIQSWPKGADSVVSEVDLAVDRLLAERLGAARPDYGWLSEETKDDPARLACARTFIVDPIDGTRAFLKGEPHFTICIAVVEARRPIATVVYNPAREELYEAIAGGGARLNGTAIAAGRRTSIAGARVLGPRRLATAAAFAGLDPPIRIEYRNSMAYRIALVAGGAFDAALGLWGSHDWDLAAADLIVAEAGGRLTTHEGADYRYNGDKTRHPSMVCAGAPLHAALVAQLAEEPL